MKNQFIIAESERQRILSLHENSTKKQYLNVLTEQEQFYKGSDGKVGKLVGPLNTLPAGATKITQQEYDTAMKTQSLTPGGDAGTTTTTTVKPVGAAETWLTLPKDKNYEYLKKDNKWFTRRKGTTKEFDLSSNPKYKASVDLLNKQFPDGKAPAGGEVKTVASATNVAVKNETLPGAPVYYPWIQDGKLNTEKLKQSIEDNSIYKWSDELKKLTPELLTKVRQDLASSGIPNNLTTTKGTGLFLALNDVLKTAEKMVAQANPQGGTETLKEIPGAGQNF
jgi:hypothetical protein